MRTKFKKRSPGTHLSDATGFVSLAADDLEELSQLPDIGWRGYLSLLSRLPSSALQLDSVDSTGDCAVHAWKQWKNRRTPIRRNCAGEVLAKDLAARTAGSRKGFWRMSAAVRRSEHGAAQEHYLDSIAGPPNLALSDLNQRLTSRTAVVRTRMPGGVTGTAREGLPMSIHGQLAS